MAWSRSSSMDERRFSSSYPNAGSLSALARRHPVSTAIVATGPAARASNCHCSGGSSQLQPTTLPAPTVSMTSGEASRGANLDPHRAAAHEIEGVGRLALLQEELTGLEALEAGTTGDERRHVQREAPQQRVLGHQLFDRTDHDGPTPGTRSACRIAAASSVRSMPTGHQAMQRPQPTHPEVPNWSHQVPSLWVSHWR